MENFENFDKVIAEKCFSIENIYSETIKENFANSLEKLINHTKVSIREMAEKLDIPFQHIYQYKDKKTEPSLSRGEKIAKYFFMSTQDFWLNEEIFDEEIEETFDKIIKEYIEYPEFKKKLQERFPKYEIPQN